MAVLHTCVAPKSTADFAAHQTWMMNEDNEHESSEPHATGWGSAARYAADGFFLSWQLPSSIHHYRASFYSGWMGIASHFEESCMSELLEKQ